MLTVNDLACIRHGQLLFHHLHFQLQPGELLHIQGANGSGKSSLLLMLLGLLPPHRGSIHWQNEAITSLGSLYYQHLVHIGHKIGIKNQLTVNENLRLVMQFGSGKTKISLPEVLQSLGLTAHSQRLCVHLSAGQRQRVALARLLLLDRPLWILDEPFTAIDAATLTYLEEKLAQHVSQGGMAIITHHRRLALPKVMIKYVQLGS